MSQLLYANAIHEAGHFVAFLLNRDDQFKSLELSIIPADGYEGHHSSNHSYKLCQGEVFESIESEKLIAITAGGYAAEWLYLEERPDKIQKRFGELLIDQHDDPASDGGTLFNLAVPHTDGDLIEYLAPYIDAVVEQLQSNWEAVTYVADVLMRVQHIDGEELEHLERATERRLKL